VKFPAAGAHAAAVPSPVDDLAKFARSVAATTIASHDRQLIASCLCWLIGVASGWPTTMAEMRKNRIACVGRRRCTPVEVTKAAGEPWRRRAGKQAPAIPFSGKALAIELKTGFAYGLPILCR